MIAPRFRLGIVLLALGIAACNGQGRVEEHADDDGQESDVQLMDEEQRHYIWEIEHHGNVLNRIAFPALADALKRNDAKAMLEKLAGNFEGWRLVDPKQVSLDNEFVH